MQTDVQNVEPRYYAELVRGNASWVEDYPTHQQRKESIRQARREGCSVLRTWSSPAPTQVNDGWPPQLFLAGHNVLCGQAVMRVHQIGDEVRYYADLVKARNIVERFNRMALRRAGRAAHG